MHILPSADASIVCHGFFALFSTICATPYIGDSHQAKHPTDVLEFPEPAENHHILLSTV